MSLSHNTVHRALKVNFYRIVAQTRRNYDLSVVMSSLYRVEPKNDKKLTLNEHNNIIHASTIYVKQTKRIDGYTW